MYHSILVDSRDILSFYHHTVTSHHNHKVTNIVDDKKINIAY